MSLTYNIIQYVIGEIPGKSHTKFFLWDIAGNKNYLMVSIRRHFNIATTEDLHVPFGGLGNRYGG